MKETKFANTLFAQPWWLDIVAPKQWKEFFVENDDDTLARIVYVTSQNRIFMPKMTQTLDLWINPRYEDNYKTIKSVIYEMSDVFLKYRFVNYTFSPQTKYVIPFRWKGYKIETSFTYRIKDLSDLEYIYNSFDKVAKKNIKAASKKVELVKKSNITHLRILLDKTFEQQGRKNPMDMDLVERIVNTCDRNGHGQYIEAVDNENNIHSCAYFVYDENACYYLIGASDPKYRSSGAQSLILWEGIKFASEHSNTFDFEGSMIEGIENFFRQFGGECVPYYSIRRVGFIKELFYLFKPTIKKILKYKD